MEMYYIQIGAVVTFRIRFQDPALAVIDISDATAKKFRFTNPNGVSIEKDASLNTHAPPRISISPGIGSSKDSSPSREEWW
jgi:hypothetical protein